MNRAYTLCGVAGEGSGDECEEVYLTTRPSGTSWIESSWIGFTMKNGSIWDCGTSVRWILRHDLPGNWHKFRHVVVQSMGFTPIAIELFAQCELCDQFLSRQSARNSIDNEMRCRIAIFP